MKKNGFTLIELLVAISIVAILSAVAVVAYSGITAKTRDGQRIRDLQAIKQALELYKADIHNYPSSLNTASPLTDCTGKDSCTSTITYLQQIPVDSNPSKNYVYKATTTSSSDCNNLSASSACLSFILCAKKEGTDTSNDLDGCNALPPSSCGVGINCDIGISSQ